MFPAGADQKRTSASGHVPCIIMVTERRDKLARHTWHTGNLCPECVSATATALQSLLQSQRGMSNEISSIMLAFKV